MRPLRPLRLLRSLRLLRPLRPLNPLSLSTPQPLSFCIYRHLSPQLPSLASSFFLTLSPSVATPPILAASQPRIFIHYETGRACRLTRRASDPSSRCDDETILTISADITRTPSADTDRNDALIPILRSRNPIDMMPGKGRRIRHLRHRQNLRDIQSIWGKWVIGIGYWVLGIGFWVLGFGF